MCVGCMCWPHVTNQLHTSYVVNVQICVGTGDYIGTVASVPLVLESSLKHDTLGYNYDNGPFMMMQR